MILLSAADHCVVHDEIALTFLMSGKWNDRRKGIGKIFLKSHFPLCSARRDGFFSSLLLMALVKVKHFRPIFNSD